MDNGNGKLHRQMTCAPIAKWFAAGLLLVIMVLVSSCGTADSELERNEKLWRSQNLTNYNYTLERQCFCPEDWRGPVNIRVRNDVISFVTYVSTGEFADAEKFGNVDTIEELFGIIHDAYEGKNTFDRKAETVNVTYHPEMGYPLTIYIDVSTMMADEEQGYTVTDLVAK